MFGAVWAQAELRKALAAAGARVVDRELPVAGADEAFGPDGSLREEDLEAELGGVLLELVDQAREHQEREQEREREDQLSKSAA